MGVIGDAIGKARKNIQDFKQQQLEVGEDIAAEKEIRGYDERKRKLRTEKKRQSGQTRREKKETRLQEKLINKGLVDGENKDMFGEGTGTYDAAGTDDGLYSDEKSILKQHRREKLRKFFSDVKGVIKGQSGNVQVEDMQAKPSTPAHPEGAVEKAKSQVIEQDKPKPADVWHEDGMGVQYNREMEKIPKGQDLHPQYKINPIPLERNVGKIGGDYKEFIKGIEDIDGKKNNS